MKYTNKMKQKQIREKRNREKQKIKKLEERKIVNTISCKQIEQIVDINKEIVIKRGHIDRESLLNCLITLFEIIKNSSYLDEITNMVRNNVSTTWFDTEIDESFIKKILDSEVENAKNSSEESIALKIMYWSNRIAHHIQEEVTPKGVKKHHINELYIKYFLNPKYHYDVFSKKPTENEEGINEMLSQVLERIDGIESEEQLNKIFFGLTLRNELWTLKQEMLRIILLRSMSVEKSTIKISAMPEGENVSINGSKTIRLIIREKNGISPVVTHCDLDKVNEFLQANSFLPISLEESLSLIDFAKDGKVGIYFTLNEEDREILDYEASCNNGKTRILNEIFYGDEEDER